MARNKWFETVAIAQQRAKKRLPKSVYSSLISASEKGLTVSDNVEAFGELGFEPHVVGIQPDRELDNRSRARYFIAGHDFSHRGAGRRS